MSCVCFKRTQKVFLFISPGHKKHKLLSLMGFVVLLQIVSYIAYNSRDFPVLYFVPFVAMCIKPGTEFSFSDVSLSSLSSFSSLELPSLMLSSF